LHAWMGRDSGNTEVWHRSRLHEQPRGCAEDCEEHDEAAEHGSGRVQEGSRSQQRGGEGKTVRNHVHGKTCVLEEGSCVTL